jgi:inhibitor of the pro-sigma K processing machinery
MNVYFVFSIISIITLLLIAGAPMKILRSAGAIVVKMIVFSIVIYGINVIGGGSGIHIPINYFTVLFTGFLGFPALLVLLAIDSFLI